MSGNKVDKNQMMKYGNSQVFKYDHWSANIVDGYVSNVDTRDPLMKK